MLDFQAGYSDLSNIYDDVYGSVYKTGTQGGAYTDTFGEEIKGMPRQLTSYQADALSNQATKFTEDMLANMAKGGRVGFVEGGWADDLTGQALATYNSMKHSHSDEVIQDTLTELGYWSPDGATEGIASIVNVQPNIIDQGGGGGGGNEFTGPGKMYDIQQWGEFGPDKPGWKDATVEGWMTSTGPKTKEGKNIFHAGLFTGDPEIGDIKETPIDWRKVPMGLWGLGIKGIKKFQDYWGGQQKNMRI